MPLFRKSLELRLFVTLLVIVCASCLALTLLMVHFQHSSAVRLTGQVTGKIEELKTLPEDQHGAAQGRIIKELEQLPGALASGTRVPAVLLALVSVFVILGAAVLLLHFGLFRPVRQLNQKLEQTLHGDEKDLTVRMSLDRPDEIGALSNRFDEFVSNLDRIILNIGGKTETITAASSEVSSASEQMEEESSDLYTRSNSVAAAAEEMNASMQSVAAASEQASANIANVAQAAGQMQSSISSIVGNCEDAGQTSNSAREQVSRAMDEVGRLGDAAKEINHVTQVITEIAEQTNLLALNATIEAARAGSAGKGFAVVADEIKHLAAQTADATQSIQEKIKGIQESTGETVKEVGNISQVISHVDDIVHDIARSVEEQSRAAKDVSENIDQASEGILEVSGNVAQSSLVAAEIAGDISRVDNVAARMSGHAGNLTQGARELDGLSVSLRQMIAVFKVSRPEEGGAEEFPVRDIPDIMPWGPKLETGLPDIDDQHKKLVKLVNLLHRAMRMQKGAKEAGKILKELTDYTVFHFGFEETLFDRHGYPETQAHKEIHKKLVEKVSAFQQEFDSGKAGLTMDLMDFLRDWLKNHILKTDMAYAPFLKEKMESV
ncbi:bacteriohemerythrin [Desulfospira joergensenii]|uniref:bacteriohemerythrin n=1 Tax=Desulfospira joergensenii TaxID=53329 RepID=UPI0006880D71|nr:bacteriohemerythrin [Desulfospira joergensenii]